MAVKLASHADSRTASLHMSPSQQSTEQDGIIPVMLRILHTVKKMFSSFIVNEFTINIKIHACDLKMLKFTKLIIFLLNHFI